MARRPNHHVLPLPSKRLLASIGAAFLFAGIAQAQTSALWERPYCKLDTVWQVSKFAALGAAQADAITTARAIDRGYVEASPLVNFMIPKDRPAYSARTARYVGEAYLINYIFNRLYKACDSRLCRITAIAGRGVFTGMSIKNSVHNQGL